MYKVQKRRESIIMYKDTMDDAAYMQIECANSQTVARPPAQNTGVEMAGNGYASMNDRLKRTGLVLETGRWIP